MGNHKYHYRDPESLKEDVNESSPVKKTGVRRGNLILIFDMAIIIMVAGILYYNNLFIGSDGASQNSFKHHHFELSATVSAGKSTEEFITFYINVKNNASRELSFPAADSTFSELQGSIAAQGVVLSEESFKLTPQPIAPGATALYPLQLKLESRQKSQNHQLKPHLEFKLDKRLHRFEFPTISGR